MQTAEVMLKRFVSNYYLKDFITVKVQ